MYNEKLTLIKKVKNVNKAIPIFPLVKIVFK